MLGAENKEQMVKQVETILRNVFSGIQKNSWFFMLPRDEFYWVRAFKKIKLGRLV